MLIALVLLFAGVASAQTNDDARALLQEIASSSRAAKSWLAEGTQVNDFTGRGMRLHSETRFKVAYPSPSKMLKETTTKETISGIDSPVPNGGLTVCDGTNHWTYNMPSTSFYRGSVEVSGCKPELGDFSKIAENLVSGTLIGRDHIQFASEARECELVRAEYSVPNVAGSATVNSVRTLCIDPVHKLVLRDHVETGSPSDVRSIETKIYERFERDSELPADLFQFQVPTGYFEDDGPEPNLIEQNGVYRMSSQVGGPKLVSKIEPFYPIDALSGEVSGIVIVSFQVGSDGSPAKLKVVRGLGHGLDEKAVETVRQWHFIPGMKDGVPVAVGPLKVAVSFRRP